MLIKSLSIRGLRGFVDQQTIEFAVPAPDAYGLTIIVGSNNSGKSTIFEGLKILSKPPHQVGEAIRSTATNLEIELILELATGERTVLSNDGGSQLHFDDPQIGPSIAQRGRVLPVPSRRVINSQHGAGAGQGVAQAFSGHLDVTRQNMNSAIDAALAVIANDPVKKQRLNDLITEIAGFSFNWTTDINSANNGYFKFRFATGDHSLEGLGEGVVSLIVMLLPFVEETHPIVTIDEPELSLHPAWQKRLFAKLVELSRNTQIMIVTHSPHFVDLGLVNQGAKIYRSYKDNQGRARIGSLQNSTVNAFGNFMNNSSNPHTFGYEMREALFIEDDIVVTEGQEDILALQRAAEQVRVPLTGNLLGWGAGGASMITKICQLLRDLGYSKVVGVFDGDETATYRQAIADHPYYKFLQIPRDDVRDKLAQPARTAKVGLLDASLNVKAGTETEVVGVLDSINHAYDP